MGYDIVTLETQNHGQDWPLIVTAVECETCGAKAGEMCRAVGALSINPLMQTSTSRIDWHAARKQAAAHAWYTRDQVPQHPETSQVKEGASSVASEGMAVGDEKRVTVGPPPPPPPPE